MKIWRKSEKSHGGREGNKYFDKRNYESFVKYIIQNGRRIKITMIRTRKMNGTRRLSKAVMLWEEKRRCGWMERKKTEWEDCTTKT